jgi:hypothetical protein
LFQDPSNSNKINFTVHINNKAGDSATVVTGAGRKTKSAAGTKIPAKPKPRTKTQVRKAITGLESPKKAKKQKLSSALAAMTMPPQPQMMMASMTRTTPMSQETAMGQLVPMGQMGPMAPRGHLASIGQMAHPMGQMATMKQMTTMGHMTSMNLGQLARQSGLNHPASMYDQYDEFAEKVQNINIF